MRFRTRAFLMCFVPFAVLLTCSFWMIQRFVQTTVRDGLRGSLRENQVAIATIHAKSDLQNSRFLKVAGENTALKAGMQLLRSEPGSEAARRTVEDQLRELGEHMGFDYLAVSGPNGVPLAGVVRQGADTAEGKSQLVPVAPAELEPTVLEHGTKGLLAISGRTFQIASVPVDQNDENIGSLAVGRYYDFSEFTTPAVLIHDSKVIESNIAGSSYATIDEALYGCAGESECEIRLQGSRWISLPMQEFGKGYLLRSLEDVDKATAPVELKLHRLFLTAALVSVLVGLLGSVASSRSIVKPIAAVVSHLRKAVYSGALPEFEGEPSSIAEIRELAESYNRAAISVRMAGEELKDAYLEFVGSLANALDARDRYTSGHSWRVSQLSYATAAAMELGADQVERVRIGALLHDIGKIGMADSLLQKRGELTDAEFAIVKEHPVIGRRILEGVQGLAPFLNAVELHHENWDGSGYPHGRVGKDTPLEARIIHVADAYDAMTTDRSYRRGMSHGEAIEILRAKAGTQYDPAIVNVFVNLPHSIFAGRPFMLEQLSDRAELLELGAG